jgi:hypothetical protein
MKWPRRLTVAAGAKGRPKRGKVVIPHSLLVPGVNLGGGTLLEKLTVAQLVVINVELRK